MNMEHSLIKFVSKIETIFWVYWGRSDLIKLNGDGDDDDWI